MRRGRQGIWAIPPASPLKAKDYPLLTARSPTRLTGYLSCGVHDGSFLLRLIVLWTDHIPFPGGLIIIRPATARAPVGRPVARVRAETN